MALLDVLAAHLDWPDPTDPWVDRLRTGMVALFRHRYGTACASLITWVTNHPRYVVPLFVATLVREPTVETYVRTDHGDGASTRITAFLAAIRPVVARFMDHETSLVQMETAVRDAWWLA